MRQPVTVWRLVDGKRGHENQTRGLCAALAARIPCREETIPVERFRPAFWRCLANRLPSGVLPDAAPALVLGAGRATHWPLLLLRRRFRVSAVVLMNPAPWLRPFFDLCLVPEHDAAKGRNVVSTIGALHAVRPGGDHDPKRGLFLIGGPSAHHDWDGGALAARVAAIADVFPGVAWKLTTSRRTPSETTRALRELNRKNLTVVPAEETGADWVPTEVAASGVAWVTEDSVSMVYEALTSGTAAGVLPVPRKRGDSRVIRGVERLAQQRLVTVFDPADPGRRPGTPARTFDEAGRCADMLVERFLAGGRVPPETGLQKKEADS